ncbi:MAG TPA: DUF3108 domain-containing protein [Gemmatimonadales bacterium]|nr:DUF3108 domain-containing protein [Gemmatimonadales bacterium]
MILLAILAAVQATAPAAAAPADTADRTLASYSFQVGEEYRYTARLGVLTVGEASMSIPAIDTVHGAATFVFRFTLNGRALFFTIDDTLTSWTGIKDFKSRRFLQKNNEDGSLWLRDRTILADSGYYRTLGDSGKSPTPDVPLDDAAFFYFVRTIPLEVGKTYSFDRYFMKDKNPIIVQVLKRDGCDLPDGRHVQCLVLAPVVKTKGMFSERAQARVYLTDDALRIPVEIRSRFPFGVIDLKLRAMKIPATDLTAN